MMRIITAVVYFLDRTFSLRMQLSNHFAMRKREDPTRTAHTSVLRISNCLRNSALTKKGSRSAETTGC
ncbi:hypothetical protein BDR22DRAFT_870925 [Usnea florida]